MRNKEWHQEIVSWLDQLSNLKAARETILGQIELLNEDAIPNEVQEEVVQLRARILEIERPYRKLVAGLIAGRQQEVEAMDQEISALEAEIKENVANFGSSVKGLSLQAVFSKGRATWDDRSLLGYGAAHPEIMAFRKEGAPSVSLRALGKEGR